MKPEILNEVRKMHGLDEIEMAPEPPDASDPAVQREQNTKARVAERHKLDALYAIMSQQQTRAWMYWLLTECRAFHGSDFANNPQAMARNLGQREISIRLTDAILRVCPDEYVLMLRENGDALERINLGGNAGG